jgi:hypothetical protein
LDWLVAAPSSDQPAGAVETDPPLSAMQATRTSPETVPAGVATTTWLLATALTTVLVASR